MKKLYLFLLAMVLSLPTFAQSISDYYGDWTLTFKDVNNGNATVTKVMTLGMNGTLGELTFEEKDGSFIFLVEYAGFSGDEITFRLGRMVDNMNINGSFPYSTYYYLDDGDETPINQAQAIYSITNNQIVQFKRPLGSSSWSNSFAEIGIKFIDYTSRANTDYTISLNYVFVDMVYGVSDGGGDSAFTPITDPSQMAGAWTFEAKKDSESTISTMAINAVYDYGEIYFNFADGDGLIYAGGMYSQDYEGTGHYLVRFESYPNIYTKPQGIDYYVDSKPFYMDGSDIIYNQIFGEFDPTTGKFIKFYRQNALKTQFLPLTEGVGFTIALYTSSAFSDATQVSKVVYNLEALYMGSPSSSEPSSSIDVKIATSAAYPETMTEAMGFAMLDVTADGFEDYKVMYNVYLDSTEIIGDTEVTPDDDMYLVYIDGLSYEMNYTFSAWAESGDYISNKATATLSPGESPMIRISASAENVTQTTADLKVTVSYWGEFNEPLVFEVTPVGNGLDLEPTQIEINNGSGTGTINLTGLTAGTTYSLDLNYVAYDQYFFSCEKENAATVTFNTVGPTLEIDPQGISYTETPGGADFTVTGVTSQGLAADAVIDVYFQLQGSDNAPAKATKGSDGAYTYSFTGLASATKYTAVIFPGVGTYGETGFIKGSEITEEFTTGEILADPEITITFPEDFVTFQNFSSYVNFTVTVDVEAENIADNAYTVYFYAAAGTLPATYNGTAGTKGVNGTYTYSMDYQSQDREYTVIVWAKANEGDYETEHIQKKFTTPGKPGVKITSAKAENVTAKTADLVITYEPTGITGDLTYSVKATSDFGPAVDPVSTKETTVTFSLVNLTPASIYTYNVTVNTSANGNMYQADLPVSFETLDAPFTIELSEISTSQITAGATVTVGKVETTGLEEDAVVDVYIQLPGVLTAPAKMTLADGKYTYTFENLEPNEPYQATVFGGVGTYGSADFLQGEGYTVRFVAGAAETTGIGSVEAAEDGARYFTLQGVEVKNPQPGIYIKVVGTEVAKVIIR